MILLEFIFGSLLVLIVAVCYIIVIAFTIWMIIDAGKQDRFWWLTIIIGVPVIGPTAYYFTEKKHEYARALPHHVHKSETEEQHEIAPKKRVRKAKVITPEIKQEKTEEVTEVITQMTPDIVEITESKQELQA